MHPASPLRPPLRLRPQLDLLELPLGNRFSVPAHPERHVARQLGAESSLSPEPSRPLQVPFESPAPEATHRELAAPCPCPPKPGHAL